MFEKLKTLITVKGFTQAQIAKKLRISSKSFNQKLNGVREFKFSELKTLSKLFKLPIEELED